LRELWDKPSAQQSGKLPVKQSDEQSGKSSGLQSGRALGAQPAREFGLQPGKLSGRQFSTPFYKLPAELLGEELQEQSVEQ